MFKRFTRLTLGILIVFSLMLAFSLPLAVSAADTSTLTSIQDLFLTALWDVLALIITVLAGMLIRFVTSKLGVEKMKLAQSQWGSMKDLASVAVKYAEQAYIEYGGAIKKEKALAFLSRELSQLGISVSNDTLNDLLEAALREIKDALGEEWVAATQTTNSTTGT